jgi:hypothetical protein
MQQQVKVTEEQGEDAARVKPMYALQTLIRESTEEFNRKWATETSTV